TGEVDLAPTWAALAGVSVPDFVDGRSLVSLLRDGAAPAAWRQAFLLEHGDIDDTQLAPPPRRRAAGDNATATADDAGDADAEGTEEPPDIEDLQRQAHRVPGIPSFAAIRTSRYTFVEYVTGEHELYDLPADPYELQNIYGSAPQALRDQLQRWLDALKNCAADTCRAAEEQSP